MSGSLLTRSRRMGVRYHFTLLVSVVLTDNGCHVLEVKRVGSLDPRASQ